MSKFALPQEVVNEVKDGMKDNSGIKLPFSAPVMWWMNGKSALQTEDSITDATRFGGWGVSKEDLDALNIAPAPAWKLKKMTSGNGGTYEAYICRTALVAPIARRFAWFENEGKSRTSVNILAFLFLRNQAGETLEYGPVVLSAKSFTGQELDNAFKKFNSLTAQLREDTPAQFFMQGVGTFGETPIFKEIKGKGGVSSLITPVQLGVPASGYTEEIMTKYFVGADMAARMAQYKKDATDWLNDWNSRGKKESAQPATQASADEYPEF